jgi:hypothetical protein
VGPDFLLGLNDDDGFEASGMTWVGNPNPDDESPEEFPVEFGTPEGSGEPVGR